jgi:hypothetical protein
MSENKVTVNPVTPFFPAIFTSKIEIGGVAPAPLPAISRRDAIAWAKHE